MSDKYNSDYTYGYNQGFNDGRNSVLKNTGLYYGKSSKNKNTIYANDIANKELFEVSRAIIVLFKMLTWLLSIVACIGLIIGFLMALLWFNQANQDPTNKVWWWTEYSGSILLIGSLVGLFAALFHLVEFFIVLFNKKTWFKNKNQPIVLGIISAVLWFYISVIILYASVNIFETSHLVFNFAEIQYYLPNINFLKNINWNPEFRTIFLVVFIPLVAILGVIGIWCLKSIDNVVESKK